MMALLEICCFNVESAVVAWKAGADRIEFCQDQDVGGTTPSLDALIRVKQQVTIPVFVMIRPRGGNFVYSDPEFDRMQSDIDAFKSVADGFVFGILDRDGQIDVQRTIRLVMGAHPLPCTFHRAFDESADVYQALEDVVATGCQTILTSGAADDAPAGAHILAELVRRANRRITIMPGGGIRSQSLRDLDAATGATSYHSSALCNGQTEPVAAEIRSMKMLLHEKPLNAAGKTVRHGEQAHDRETRLPQ